MDADLRCVVFGIVRPCGAVCSAHDYHAQRLVQAHLIGRERQRDVQRFSWRDEHAFGLNPVQY